MSRFSRRWDLFFRPIAHLIPLCLLTLVCAARQPVEASHGMVVAQEPIAADVGLEVLRKGGNAVDAAVAVGFALAVTHPSAGNIGGGGFLLARFDDGHTDFFDFREMAPAGASRNMYLDRNGNPTEDSIFGWRSAGVPGTVAGLADAHKKFGTLPWKDLLDPAIKLAADGFTLTEPVAASLRNEKNSLHRDAESRRIFLRDGNPYKAGETLKQPDLAKTLRRIADKGTAGFYEGPTAKHIAAAFAAHGGLITEEDLRRYQAKERKPVAGTYHGFDVISAPPPSAGGVGLLQMLGMLDGTGYDKDGPDSARAVHFGAEVMRRFYADRSEYLGDSDFYNVPVKQLLAPSYVAWRRSTISPDRATPSDRVEPGLDQRAVARVRYGHESDQTTHFNVVDAQGDAVAVTYTLNNTYGNGITVPGLGFLLNDEMDDFSAKPGTPNMYGLLGSDANAVEARKRPLSAMTPTIVTHNGKLKMVVGAPGGSRITTGVFQVVLDVLDFHMNAQEAVDLPRYHEQWKPDILYLEPDFPTAVEGQLKQMGYRTEMMREIARVEAIVVNGSKLQGGSRAQVHGKVAGY